MTERLNIEGLRYARAVAETGSFSAAARAYGVTQPALSNGIARLEERLGARVFERSPRGVVLTAFGAQILPFIVRAVDGVEAVSAEASRLTEPLRPGMRIGVSPLIDPQLVSRAFAAARELQTPRDLVLREANMKDLRDELIAGQLDVILIPSVEPMPRFRHRIIDSEPVVVVGSDEADGAQIGLEESARDPLILVPDSCGLTTFTHRLFADHGLGMSTYPGEAASYRVLEQWAALGLGSAILPLSKLSSPHAAHRPLLDDGMPVEIFYEAVWQNTSPVAAAVDALTQALADSSRATRETAAA